MLAEFKTEIRPDYQVPFRRTHSIQGLLARYSLCRTFTLEMLSEDLDTYESYSRIPMDSILSGR